MVLKKLGFKSGSWLLNVEPKSKSESNKDSKTSAPKSGKSSLSILEEDFIRGSPSQNDPYSLHSPASPVTAAPPVSNESMRQSRRQSNLPTAKALFKMFVSGSKKDKIESGQDLRRATLSVSTSQLDSSSKHQSSSSLVAPSFTSQYYSPKSDQYTSGTTFETLPEHSTRESLSSPTSPASVKPFTKAESASYTISNLEGHSRPRALSSFEVIESPLSPRPNAIVFDRSKSYFAPGESSFIPSISPHTSHHRTASVGPSPLKTKNSNSEVKKISRSDSSPKKLSRHSSILSNNDSKKSKPKSVLVEEELTSSSKVEIGLLTSKLAEVEKDHDGQQAIINQLKAEVSRGEQDLELERFSARQELEALLELQQQYQVSQRTVREGEAVRKSLESKLDELQNQLQAARDELGGLRHQSQSREELLSERVQLRSWLNEEKVRHNEVREEYTETKSKFKANLSRMNHLEALIQDQTERIKNYEIREAASNESSMKEVIYYQEQLAEAIRSRDEIREENERNKEQIRVLRTTMEQLLKAGVTSEPIRESSPALSFVHYNNNTSELRSVKDSGHSTSSHSQSNPSLYNEEIENSEIMNNSQSRHGLGTDRRRTFGLDSQVTGSAPLSPIYLSREISLISPKESESTKSPIVGENTTEFWDAKLKVLLKEKERTELEYSRIPTKVNKSMRLRKEELENLLDRLDSDISGARSRIRTLVI